MKDSQGHGSNGRGYRGKYPNKIRAVSGGSGGHGFALVETNSGERRSVHAKDTGGMYPKMGADLNDYKHTSADDYRSAQADSMAARQMAQGHPKSAVVDTHPAHAGGGLTADDKAAMRANNQEPHQKAGAAKLSRRIFGK